MRDRAGQSELKKKVGATSQGCGIQCGRLSCRRRMGVPRLIKCQAFQM